jgi:hypothetical protein
VTGNKDLFVEPRFVFSYEVFDDQTIIRFVGFHSAYLATCRPASFGSADCASKTMQCRAAF